MADSPEQTSGIVIPGGSVSKNWDEFNTPASMFGESKIFDVNTSAAIAATALYDMWMVDDMPRAIDTITEVYEDLQSRIMSDIVIADAPGKAHIYYDNPIVAERKNDEIHSFSFEPFVCVAKGELSLRRLVALYNFCRSGDFRRAGSVHDDQFLSRTLRDVGSDHRAMLDQTEGSLGVESSGLYAAALFGVVEKFPSDKEGDDPRFYHDTHFNLEEPLPRYLLEAFNAYVTNFERGDSPEPKRVLVPSIMDPCEAIFLSAVRRVQGFSTTPVRHEKDFLVGFPELTDEHDRMLTLHKSQHTTGTSFQIQRPRERVGIGITLSASKS